MKRANILLVVLSILFSCSGDQPFVPGFSSISTHLSVTIPYLEGEASITRDDSTMSLAAGMSLAMGDEVTTAAGAFCVLSIGWDGTELSTVRVAENSVLHVRTLFETAAAGRVIDIGLEVGTILCRVRTLSAPDFYAVSTRHGVFGVRGTEFAVTATDVSSTVSVTQGSVALLPPAVDPARLAAGFGSTETTWTQTVSELLDGAPALQTGEETTLSIETFSEVDREVLEVLSTANREARDATADRAAAIEAIGILVRRLGTVRPSVRPIGDEIRSRMDELRWKGAEVPSGYIRIHFDQDIFLLSENTDSGPIFMGEIGAYVANITFDQEGGVDFLKLIMLTQVQRIVDESQNNTYTVDSSPGIQLAIWLEMHDSSEGVMTLGRTLIDNTKLEIDTSYTTDPINFLNSDQPMVGVLVYNSQDRMWNCRLSEQNEVNIVTD